MTCILIIISNDEHKQKILNIIKSVLNNEILKIIKNRIKLKIVIFHVTFFKDNDSY